MYAMSVSRTAHSNESQGSQIVRIAHRLLIIGGSMEKRNRIMAIAKEAIASGFGGRGMKALTRKYEL